MTNCNITVILQRLILYSNTQDDQVHESLITLGEHKGSESIFRGPTGGRVLCMEDSSRKAVFIIKAAAYLSLVQRPYLAQEYMAKIGHLTGMTKICWMRMFHLRLKRCRRL